MSFSGRESTILGLLVLALCDTSASTMGKKGVKENKEAKLRKREEARRKATRSKRIDEVIKYGPVLGAVVIGT